MCALWVTHLRWIFSMEIPTWYGLTSFCKHHLVKLLRKICCTSNKIQQTVCVRALNSWFESIYSLERRDKSGTFRSIYKDSASSLQVREGYRVISGTVDFCIDDVLDKIDCVIGDSMNLRTGRKRLCSVWKSEYLIWHLPHEPFLSQTQSWRLEAEQSAKPSGTNLWFRDI